MTIKSAQDVENTAKMDSVQNARMLEALRERIKVVSRKVGEATEFEDAQVVLQDYLMGLAGTAPEPDVQWAPYTLSYFELGVWGNYDLEVFKNQGMWFWKLILHCNRFTKDGVSKILKHGMASNADGARSRVTAELQLERMAIENASLTES